MYKINFRMTTKVTTAIEYMELCNESRALEIEVAKLRDSTLTDESQVRCKSPHYDIQAMIDDGQFRKFIGRYSEGTLSDMVASQKTFQEEQLGAKYNLIAETTDEYKGYKLEYDSKYRSLSNTLEKVMLDHQMHLRNVVQSTLGAKWSVNLTSDFAKVGILADGESENNEKNEYVNFLFGHDFYIYYRHNWLRTGEEPHIDFNYGTMGSFDVRKDTTEVDLICGIARCTQEDMISSFEIVFNDIHSTKLCASNMIEELKEEFDKKVEALAERLRNESSSERGE